MLREEKSLMQAQPESKLLVTLDLETYHQLALTDVDVASSDDWKANLYEKV